MIRLFPKLSKSGLSILRASTENQISGIRAAYNNTVFSMNNAVEMFPSNIIAGIFNFSKGVFFEVDDEAEREAPKVSFG